MKIIENMPMEGAPYYNDKKWVSPMNFLNEVMTETTSKKIYIHDVTLRDGEQTCGLNWTEDERVDIAVALKSAFQLSKLPNSFTIASTALY